MNLSVVTTYDIPSPSAHVASTTAHHPAISWVLDPCKFYGWIRMWPHTCTVWEYYEHSSQARIYSLVQYCLRDRCMQRPVPSIFTRSFAFLVLPYSFPIYWGLCLSPLWSSSAYQWHCYNVVPRSRTQDTLAPAKTVTSNTKYQEWLSLGDKLESDTR